MTPLRVRGTIVWAAVVFCSGLVSCRTAPEEVDPPVRVPEAFTATGEAPLPGKWWRSFEDPELERLVNLSLSGNLDLRTAWDRFAQAEAIARREGADLLPKLDLVAGARSTARRDELADGKRETTRFNTFNVGALAEYEVDLWGRIRSARDAAELDALASAEDLQAAAVSLSAQVARTWYQLVEQYAQLEILADQLATNRKVLELITLRFRRGQIGAADVLRQRQLVESGLGAIEVRESLAGVLENQMAILLGRPPQEPVARKVTELAALPPLPDSGLPADLVKRRPDIRRAHLEVLAADRRAASAVADRFPRLFLTGRIETTTEEVGDLFKDWLATIAAELVGPILDGGRRSAEVDRTRAVLSERLHDYGRVVLVSFGEVEDALVRERKQRDFIESLERQLELSGQVVDRIGDSYINGAVNYIDVLQALLSNQSLQQNLLAARRQLIEYRIDLCRALAGGFEMARPDLASLESKPDQGDRNDATK